MGSQSAPITHHTPPKTGSGSYPARARARTRMHAPVHHHHSLPCPRHTQDPCPTQLSRPEIPQRSTLSNWCDGDRHPGFRQLMLCCAHVFIVCWQLNTAGQHNKPFATATASHHRDTGFIGPRCCRPLCVCVVRYAYAVCCACVVCCVVSPAVRVLSAAIRC